MNFWGKGVRLCAWIVCTFNVHWFLNLPLLWLVIVITPALAFGHSLKRYSKYRPLIKHSTFKLKENWPRTYPWFAIQQKNWKEWDKGAASSTVSGTGKAVWPVSSSLTFMYSTSFESRHLSKVKIYYRAGNIFWPDCWICSLLQAE